MFDLNPLVDASADWEFVKENDCVAVLHCEADPEPDVEPVIEGDRESDGDCEPECVADTETVVLGEGVKLEDGEVEAVVLGDDVPVVDCVTDRERILGDIVVDAV